MFTTKAVNEKMSADPIFSLFVFQSLNRFLARDWGEVSPEDAATNNAAPEYALGAYIDENGVKIWIKADDPAITVLFPSEY
ncbi:hypothetical protein [Anaerotignum lactatifermentans]|uniref:hypothetical protein n=1 Tax=Anaerotignum lactatifermentans TaxID=160404 RepID=UPI0030797CFB